MVLILISTYERGKRYRGKFYQFFCDTIHVIIPLGGINMERLEIFNNYFTKYQQPIIYFSYAILKSVEMAEDVTQEVFEALFIRLGYNNQLEMVDDWIFATARNISIDYLRKKNLRNYTPLDENIGYDGMSEMINRLFTWTLLDDLREHNQRWYDVVEMHYILGMKTEEIAGVLQCTNASVKNSLKRAKKYLLAKHSKSDTTLFMFLVFVYIFIITGELL